MTERTRNATDLPAIGDKANTAAQCIALPGWRWLPGMLGCRAPAGGADDLRPEIRVTDAASAATAERWGCVPDLDDPATAGAMLDLIAQADVEAGWGRSVQVEYRRAGNQHWSGLTLAGYGEWPQDAPGRRDEDGRPKEWPGVQRMAAGSLGEAIALLAVARGTWL